MVERPCHRAGRPAVLLAAVAAVAVLLAVPAVWGAPVTGTPSSSVAPAGSTAELAGDVPAVFATPFWERAGYSSAYGAESTDVGPAPGPILVSITFVPRNASEFFATPAPGARPLTNAGIAARYGLSVAQYTSVERYFESEGLTVLHSWPDRLSLSLEGPVGAVDAAFATSVVAGTEDGVPVTYPSSAPTLPASIEPLVGSVLGLSSGFDAFTTDLTPPVEASDAGPAQAATSEVTPPIARYIYGLSSLYNVSGSFHSAANESIALLLWGYGYDPSDLSTFFANDYPSSFPAPTIEAYPVDGAPSPSANAVNDPCKASQELTLDLEWSGSMAPGATLDAVYAPESASPGCSPSDAAMADAMNEAVSLPVAAISMSFGTPDPTSGGLNAAWSTDLSVAVQKDISLLAATGDLGGAADANCKGGAEVQYPSTSPDVLAVGGTDVSLTYPVFGGSPSFTETAWSGSGGGVSTVYAAPVWQSSASGERWVPDVAATAADNYLYWGGQNLAAAGTSFATPLWAGLVAEMDAIHGTPFGLIAPRLYAIGNAENSSSHTVATGLAAVTSGSNCFYSAGPGWNAVTGWGSPRALNLYEDLTATFVNLTISTSSSTVAPGGSITISGRLANATSGTAIPNVAVTVSLVASSSIGPCTGTFGSVVARTGPAGNVSASVAVPSCYFGSHASAQLLVTSDGYYGTNSTTVAVNLLGLVPGLAFLAVFPYNVVTFVAVVALASAIGYVLGRRTRRRGRSPGPAGPAPGAEAAEGSLPAGAAGASAPDDAPPAEESESR